MSLVVIRFFFSQIQTSDVWKIPTKSIISRPSLTTDHITYHEDNEYLHAEKLGQEGAPCERVFNDCKVSILDQFTGIYTTKPNELFT